MSKKKDISNSSESCGPTWSLTKLPVPHILWLSQVLGLRMLSLAPRKTYICLGSAFGWVQGCLVITLPLVPLNEDPCENKTCWSISSLLIFAYSIHNDFESLSAIEKSFFTFSIRFVCPTYNYWDSHGEVARPYWRRCPLGNKITACF